MTTPRARFAPFLIAAAVGLAAAHGTARAQDRPTPSQPPALDCRPAPPPTGGTGQAPSGQAPSGSTGAPSDKLSQSGGVICPPAGVDPSIQKPAPEAGRTPVIPPPGSPGSNSPVRPK